MRSIEDAKSRLCVALDVGTLHEAESAVRELVGEVGLFKVGSELFTSEGPQVVDLIRRLGGKVFLDLKFHDIPNTVASAVRVAAGLGVTFLNLHASGGKVMMEAAVAAAKEVRRKGEIEAPKILAVTVLTSLSEEVLRSELSVSRGLMDQVCALAKLAQESGVDGVIASAQEVRSIRKACGDSFVIVTPGIRLAGADIQDQKRVTTPGEAIAMGADYIVVGRPIMKAEDRVAVCRNIVAEMGRQ